MISSERFAECAKMLQCEVAAIKAVTEVESGGTGFLSTGEPVILFEPHIFWNRLKIHQLNPATFVAGNEDILYQHWGAHPYGKSSEQHGRLERATKIDRASALESCSWGMFQIMGYHYKACGCKDLQEFINAMYKSEDEHLRLFVNFIKTNGYDAYLRAKDWRSFALHYNGAAYEKNKYHLKLNTAYLKYAH
jgi:hypothetical protein